MDPGQINKLDNTSNFTPTTIIRVEKFQKSFLNRLMNIISINRTIVPDKKDASI